VVACGPTTNSVGISVGIEGRWTKITLRYQYIANFLRIPPCYDVVTFMPYQSLSNIPI
jgi:hypothetical protein